MKSLAVGELVQLKDGKLAEVLEVSEDGKKYKIHVRTGARVADSYVPEFDVKKANKGGR